MTDCTCSICRHPSRVAWQWWQAAKRGLEPQNGDEAMQKLRNGRNDAPRRFYGVLGAR